jgi:hypothetical protein
VITRKRRTPRARLEGSGFGFPRGLKQMIQIIPAMNKSPPNPPKK